jgi:sphinganine-1-phosphate aldolase
MTRSTMPASGSAPASVMSRLEEYRRNDLRWKDGRAFSLAYFAGEEAYEVAMEAQRRFSSENALNMDAFPSLRALSSEVIGTTCELLGGDDKTVGVFTSGGTESILTAVKGAKEWGKTRGIHRPRMILPTTAHAAFSKAANYFDVEAVRIPVNAQYLADTQAMAAAIDVDTVLLVGSAPSYPQGVIDPIDELGRLAEDHDLLFHVDACMGFTLPWLERLGLMNKRWNFAVPGVTSMSCDLHKFGYTAKGASILAHRSKELRKHQLFITSDWLGGLYGSAAMLGTRSGGSIAAAWAVFQHLGQDGYLRLTEQAFTARQKIQAGLTAIDGVVVRGEPEATLVAFGAPSDGPTGPAVVTANGEPPVDIYAVADRLWADGGWYCDRQAPPDSLHCTVNAVHLGVADEFVAAVSTAVLDQRADSMRTGDRTKAYGTVE